MNATPVPGGFRGTADAGPFLLVVVGVGSGPEKSARTALYPELNRPPGTTTGRQRLELLYRTRPPQRAPISGSFQIDSMRDAKD